MVKVQKDSPVSAEDAIVRRLNVIIRLLLDEQRASQKTKKNDQLLSLYSLGLTSPEIAQIIGWDGRRIDSGTADTRISKVSMQTIFRIIK